LCFSFFISAFTITTLPKPAKSYCHFYNVFSFQCKYYLLQGLNISTEQNYILGKSTNLFRILNNVCFSYSSL
jgi:hypothetical protein